MTITKQDRIHVEAFGTAMERELLDEIDAMTRSRNTNYEAAMSIQHRLNIVQDKHDHLRAQAKRLREVIPLLMVSMLAADTRFDTVWAYGEAQKVLDATKDLK